MFSAFSKKENDTKTVNIRVPLIRIQMFYPMAQYSHDFQKTYS